MITVRQLQYVLAVVRHKHFKRAAEECKISQSALSLGLSEFERVLGVTMFERSNKQVVLTRAGSELIGLCQQAYADVQKIVEVAHSKQPSFTFPMSIGFIPTISPFLLPVSIPMIHSEYPNSFIDIHEDMSYRLVQSVQMGHIDAAVLALPFDIPGLEAYEFATENFFVIAHKDSEIINEVKKKQMNIVKQNLLKKYPPLLLGDGHCMRAHIMEVCKLTIDDDINMFKNSSLNTLIQLTINNLGYTLIPQMAIPKIQNYPQVEIMRIDIAGPHRRLAMVTRRDYPRLQELKLLMDVFKRALIKQRDIAYDHIHHEKDYAPENSVETLNTIDS